MWGVWVSHVIFNTTNKEVTLLMCGGLKLQRLVKFAEKLRWFDKIVWSWRLHGDLLNCRWLLWSQLLEGMTCQHSGARSVLQWMELAQDPIRSDVKGHPLTETICYHGTTVTPEPALITDVDWEMCLKVTKVLSVHLSVDKNILS